MLKVLHGCIYTIPCYCILLCVYLPFTIDAPDIDITMVDRCVSSLNITWNDATQCVPVDYTVILTNTSSGELQNNIINGNSFSFPRLTSNTSFTITVSGTNRFGQNASMMLTSTLKSNGKVLPILVLYFFACVTLYCCIASNYD